MARPRKVKETPEPSGSGVPPAEVPEKKVVPELSEASTLGELNRMRERKCSFVDYITRAK